jgi:hypothetical protein
MDETDYVAARALRHVEQSQPGDLPPGAGELTRLVLDLRLVVIDLLKVLIKERAKRGHQMATVVEALAADNAERERRRLPRP